MARRWRVVTTRTLLILGVMSLTVTSIYLALHTPSPQGETRCDCPKNDPQGRDTQDKPQGDDSRDPPWPGQGAQQAGVPATPVPHPGGETPEWGPHRLAVLVPFRDRFEELLQFVPYMHDFLSRKMIRHKIFIVQQVDGYRFNRASLINAGFLQARDECDYIAMHDVDLLPANQALDYSYPSDGPFHVASPELHPKYHYPNFVGGILLLTNEQFQGVNGLSNKFWGWGREDDEFYVRMKEAGYKIRRPANIETGPADTFQHLHNKVVRPRDYGRYGEQKIAQRTRDRTTGVDTVQYTLKSVSDISVSGSPATILNVELLCDLDQTAWCMTPEQTDAYLKELARSDYAEAQRLREKLLGRDGVLVKHVTDPYHLRHRANEQQRPLDKHGQG